MELEVYDINKFICQFELQGIVIFEENEIIKYKPEIGKGSFGKVYKGKCNGVYVAIKKLKLSIDDTEIIKIISNEIEIIKIAKHPRLPKFYGLWVQKNCFHLIFEYINGPTLNEISFDLTKIQKLTIILQLAETLSSMHKKKLIHRDIKPSNIMLQNNNIVRLIDFGTSIIASKTLTFTCLSIVTIPYLSPEQVDGYDSNGLDDIFIPIAVSSKIDIWSLGCLMSELFSGIKPWFNISKNEIVILRKLFKKKSFPIPAKIQDEEIKSIIRLMVEVDPNKRASADDIVNILRKLI